MIGSIGKFTEVVASLLTKDEKLVNKLVIIAMGIGLFIIGFKVFRE